MNIYNMHFNLKCILLKFQISWNFVMKWAEQIERRHAIHRYLEPIYEIKRKLDDDYHMKYTLKIHDISIFFLIIMIVKN